MRPWSLTRWRHTGESRKPRERGAGFCQLGFELPTPHREEVKRVVLDSAPAQMFRRLLFARVVPNLRRLGLLTPRVREAFERLGILEFEHADPEAQDRALGLA